MKIYFEPSVLFQLAFVSLGHIARLALVPLRLGQTLHMTLVLVVPEVFAAIDATKRIGATAAKSMRLNLILFQSGAAFIACKVDHFFFDILK